jgi:hypothetical protein
MHRSYGFHSKVQTFFNIFEVAMISSCHIYLVQQNRNAGQYKMKLRLINDQCFSFYNSLDDRITDGYEQQYSIGYHRLHAVCRAYSKT